MNRGSAPEPPPPDWLDDWPFEIAPPDPPPTAPAALAAPAAPAGPAEPATSGARTQLAVALAAVPIAGITRRRAGWAVVAALTVWVVLVFAEQVGAASAAQAEAAAVRDSNAALSASVDALGRELQTVQQQRFVLQQARAFRLGSTAERPFELAPDAPALPPDAPGSAAVRLGVRAHAETPLESWLSLLFGPDPGR